VMDVSATVNGDIAMDVSSKVKWWHCGGRLAEGENGVVVMDLSTKVKWRRCDEHVGEGKMLTLSWTYRRR
jgi:hypothetical protein